MLYIILIANNRVVTLIRPKKHSIHPAGRSNCISLVILAHLYFSDLHIILNTIHSPSIYNSPANASWIPVCLPKFNPSGFVNAYITARSILSSSTPLMIYYVLVKRRHVAHSHPKRDQKWDPSSVGPIFFQ